MAFSDGAAFDADVAARVRDVDAGIRANFASLIRRGLSEGEVVPGLEPEVAARTVMAVMGGLTMQLLYDPLPESDVRRLVEAALNLLLPHP